MKITEETSQKIKNMSLLCAMLVVTIHVKWPSDTFSFTWLVNQVVREGIARIAVPFFFVVSGFFLARHMSDPGWHGREVRKRIFSLVIPYFIWAILGSILFSLPAIADDVLANRPFGFSLPFSDGRWVKTLVLDLLRAPSCLGALWYVKCLFAFVLIAPVFKWLVLRGGFLWLAFAFALNLVHASGELFPPLLYLFFLNRFSLSGMFYFSVGIYIGLSDVRETTRASFLACAAVGLALLLAKSMLAFFAVDPRVDLTTCAIPFLMYAFWCLIPDSKWSNALTSCSFPIFLLHSPLEFYFIVPMKHSPLCGSQIGSVLIFVCTLVSSVLVAIVMRKSFPRLNAFLFAGRS